MRNMIRVLALLLCAAHGCASAQDKAPAPQANTADKPLYKVVDGYKVDPATMNGFRACHPRSRCPAPPPSSPA
jgi:hypothetical protein